VIALEELVLDHSVGIVSTAVRRAIARQSVMRSVPVLILQWRISRDLPGSDEYHGYPCNVVF
jgi:hypothetical protein